MNVTDEELLQALDRIAATPDGEFLYLYLQRAVCELPLTLEPGALQAHHGRRSLAAELMARMAKGIEASGGRDYTSTGQRTERTVIVRSGAVDASAGKRRTARDYFRNNDPELAESKPAGR